jgi:DNA-binding NtrC family response regulator
MDVTNMKKLKLLMIEDNDCDIQLVKRELSRVWDVELTVVSDPKELLNVIRQSEFDVIISDYRLHMWTGIDALGQVQRHSKKQSPFILLTGMLGEEIAVECLKMGVYDYVLKDNLSRLVPAIERALQDVVFSFNPSMSNETANRALCSILGFKIFNRKLVCGCKEAMILMDERRETATVIGCLKHFDLRESIISQWKDERAMSA